MLDDWKINWELHDLPPEVWDFIKQQRFFGMIIPKEYGGLGFSRLRPFRSGAQSLDALASTAAVTVMVPNSLGPGELLMHFGTEEQQQYWLPRLADGREIPCFGLTSPEAGSDAAAMTDIGVVCKGEYEGREVLGIRLNWQKRYITLGPVATVLGLAFKLLDPDHLLGERGRPRHHGRADPDTTCRASRSAAATCRRCRFSRTARTGARDVFIPLDYIIGGRGAGRPGLEDADERARRRPRHLAAVAVGGGVRPIARAPPAPTRASASSSAFRSASSKASQEPLARIAGTAYLLDARAPAHLRRRSTRATSRR